MAKIRFVRPDNALHARGVDSFPENRREKALARYSATELEQWERWSYLPVDDEDLQLTDTRIGPNVRLDSHAHSTSEIIYVTEGELRFGSQVCPTGTAIYIAANTLYGFQAGPNGSRFLNFRSETTVAYLTKEEVGSVRDRK